MHKLPKRDNGNFAHAQRILSRHCPKSLELVDEEAQWPFLGKKVKRVIGNQNERN
jgi:hypothetical protein